MDRRSNRKFHFIYKTTRFDGKFYIGMHSTDNIDDDYFGSGILIGKSLAKYGKEMHIREIIEFLPDRISLEEKERELVTKELLKDPLCMNLKVGGRGGGHFFSKEQLRKASSAGATSPNRNHTEIQKKINETKRIRNSFNRKQWGNWLGRKQTEAHKAKTAATKKERGTGIGEKNSQFGTCWITKDGTKPIKIKKEELDGYLNDGYRRGRK